MSRCHSLSSFAVAVQPALPVRVSSEARASLGTLLRTIWFALDCTTSGALRPALGCGGRLCRLHGWVNVFAVSIVARIEEPRLGSHAAGAKRTVPVPRHIPGPNFERCHHGIVLRALLSPHVLEHAITLEYEHLQPPLCTVVLVVPRHVARQSKNPLRENRHLDLA